MPSIADRYREWFEQEIDSNDKMLGMIESVPNERLSDPRFQRAVTLAAHLAACRENRLDRMINDSKNQVPWWEEEAQLETLRPRYAAMEKSWSDYLAKVDEKELARNFEFPASQGTKYRWNIEGTSKDKSCKWSATRFIIVARSHCSSTNLAARQSIRIICIGRFRGIRNGDLSVISNP